MKKVFWRVLCAGVVMAGLSGCVSTGTRGVEVGDSVAPGPGERVTVDEVIVVVDVSGSMYGPDKYRLAKELTRSFVSAMPDGDYRAGLLTFGGEWTNEWVRQPAVPLDRDALLSKVAQIKWQRGSTPLPGALGELQPGIQQRSGRTAVVILSDGGADRQSTLDIVDHMKNTHEGELCFYTVHLGHGSCFGVGDVVIGDGECCHAHRKCDSHKACDGDKKCDDDKKCDHAEKKAGCCEGEKKEAAGACGGKPAACTEKSKECADKPKACGAEHKDCGSCDMVLEGTMSPDLRENGHALLGAIVKIAGCGKLWEAEDVIKQPGMEDMIRTIFFGNGDGDSDGDGVPDSIDECPDTPRGAKVDARGCWVLAGLNFDFDKSNIKPEFNGLLDDVAKVLLDNRGMNLTIHVRVDGHTDSIGSTTYNQGLSERRAASVKAALINRGVDPARLTTQGFGETKPAATNKTPAGRYQNRRVELTPVK